MLQSLFMQSFYLNQTTQFNPSLQGAWKANSEVNRPANA